MRVDAAGRPLPAVRLLHTSDLHVAADGSGLAALEAVVRAATDWSVDLVVIAGDLFDHARVPDDTIGATLDALSLLRQPVVVVPGNHDCIDDDSIYRRVDLGAAGGHVAFASDPAGEERQFPTLGLCVWARGIRHHEPANRPLAGCRTPGPEQWRLVVTHGHHVAEGEAAWRSSPITAAELAALDCDYVALGHWHRAADVSAGAVTAWYCGSPSEPGQTAEVNLVLLDPHDGVQVTRRALDEPGGPPAPDGGAARVP